MNGRKKRILVLDAECNASTSIVQSLGRAEYEIYLAGLSQEAFSFRSRYVQKHFVYPSPLESKKNFLDWFAGMTNQVSFDHIIPASDVTIYPLREVFPKNENLVLPPEEGFEFFFDKSLTIELAEKLGVPVPNTVIIKDQGDFDLHQFLRFPYFVKLSRSKTWKGDKGFDLDARLVRTGPELRDSLKELLPFGPVLIQEYESGDGVGIELLCDQGEVLLSFAHRRLHEYPLTGGGSSYRVSIEMPSLLFESAKRLVEATRWQGVAMVEFKWDRSQYSLMEVNGRFWGSLPLSYRSGVDFPKALVELREGKRPVHIPYRVGVRSRRFSTDFSWFKRNLVSDKKDPYLKTRPLVTTLLEYGGFLTGRDHWDHGYFSDPMPALIEVGSTLQKTSSQILEKGWKKISRIAESSFDKRRVESFETVNRVGNPHKILVLCYGNICRSPFVEAVLRQFLPASQYEVQSCGFIPRENRQSPEQFQEIALLAGIDLSMHRSRCISKELLEWADIVLLMDRMNEKHLLEFHSDSLKKTVWLGAWGTDKDIDIPDPYGRKNEEMEKIVWKMKTGSENLGKFLIMEGDK